MKNINKTTDEQPNFNVLYNVLGVLRRWFTERDLPPLPLQNRVLSRVPTAMPNVRCHPASDKRREPGKRHRSAALRAAGQRQRRERGDGRRSDRHGLRFGVRDRKREAERQRECGEQRGLRVQERHHVQVLRSRLHRQDGVRGARGDGPRQQGALLLHRLQHGLLGSAAIHCASEERPSERQAVQLSTVSQDFRQEV